MAKTARPGVGFSDELMSEARHRDWIICGVEAAKARNNDELLGKINSVLDSLIEVEDKKPEEPEPECEQKEKSDMEFNWVEFDPRNGPYQTLPQYKRFVLVNIPERKGDTGSLPPTVAVGYLKYTGGDKNCPYFVIPGVGGIPTHWCDCLTDSFYAPQWKGRQTLEEKEES